MSVPKQRVESQVKWFDMTYHQSVKHLTPDYLIGLFDKYCDKWGFQYEEGDETGAQHYQIRVSMKEKIRASTLRKWDDFYGFHITPTSKENQNNFTYVTKDSTRIGGPWHYSTDAPLLIPRQCRAIRQWFPWQEYIIRTANDWEPRVINILYEPEGNKGKTILSNFLLTIKKAFLLPILEDYKDFMQAVCSMVKDVQNSQLQKTTDLGRMFIIDIPRALDKGKQKKLFAAIETVKGGYAFDTRNHFKYVTFDSPVVWVFTNHLPERDLVSNDRWKYWTIDRHNKLVSTDYSTYVARQQQIVKANDDHIQKIINK